MYIYYCKFEYLPSKMFYSIFIIAKLVLFFLLLFDKYLLRYDLKLSSNLTNCSIEQYSDLMLRDQI